jgi:hypothetical protein
MSTTLNILKNFFVGVAALTFVGLTIFGIIWLDTHIHLRAIVFFCLCLYMIWWLGDLLRRNWKYLKGQSS